MPKQANLPNHWLAKACDLHHYLAQHHFTLVVGLEGEFYLPPDLDADSCEKIIAECNNALAMPLVAEDGHRQFEYHIAPQSSLDLVLHQQQLAISAIEKSSNHQAVFAGKPYANQPSSGMHVHLHAEDMSGNKLFSNTQGQISEALEYSLAGLVANLEEAAALLLISNHEERFVLREDHVATTVSWGYNNRSCAIRLPSTPPDHTRIEYRIAPSDVCLEMLLAVIFASMIDGVERRPDLPPATYGNAGDSQYNLKVFPQNREEAEQGLSTHFRLRHRLA